MVIHGVGIPIQDNDPNEFEYSDIPFITWNAAYCHKSNHYPMIYSLQDAPEICDDGRPLLVFNEPEYQGQANLYPDEAAEHLRKFREWSGPVYGCGNAWFSDGWKWFQRFLIEIGEDIDILDGLHFHCYSNAMAMDLYDDYALKWAGLAKSYGWPIIISEYGITNANDEYRDIFLRYLINTFEPQAMFLFSWKYHLIPELNMVDSNGELTDIGRWWFSRCHPNEQVFLPTVQK